MIYHAVTFTQPYAELAACGEKRIDNRAYAPSAKYLYQRLGVHAGLKLDEKDTFGLLARNPKFPLMPAATYSYGALIGSVRLVGWGKRAKKEWKLTGKFSDEEWDAFLSSSWLAEKTKCFWVFDQPEIFKPIPCRGSLQIWKIPADILPEVKKATKYKQEMEVISETGVHEITEELIDMAQPNWKKKIDPHYCAIVGCGRSAVGYYALDDRYYPLCKPDGAGVELRSAHVVAERGGSAEGIAALLRISTAEGQKFLEIVDKQGDVTPEPEPVPADSARHEAEIVAPDDEGLERATAVALIPQEELKGLLENANLLWSKVENFFPTTQPALDLAKEIAATTKLEHKELDRRRKAINEPFDTGKKKVQDAFNPVLKQLLKIEEHLKERMIAGLKAVNAAQDVALQRIEEAHTQGDVHAAAHATQLAQSHSVEAPNGTFIRDLVDFEVVDISQVPGQFFVLDEAKVRDVLRAGLVIPGIRRVDRQSMTLRA